MAAGSIIAGVIDFYNTLTAANFPSATRPAIWLDEAPQQTAAGAQQRLPYVIIQDNGGLPKWTFTSSVATTYGQNAIVEADFSITAYAETLANCDTIMASILGNGSTPNARAGLAFAILSLNSPLKGMTIVPGFSQANYAGFNYQGKRAYKLRQDFSAQASLSGTGYP